jgi:hypothetical protein
MKLTNIIYIFVLVILVNSCSQSPEKGIVGKWKQTETGSVYEFFENGDLKVTENYGLVAGKYTLSNNHKLDMTFLNSGTSAIRLPIMQANININNDTLKISFVESGIRQNIKFERIKE